jgi:hypothetical protein
MIAKACDDILVESVEECEGVNFLRIRLTGEHHYGMFQHYQSLPSVLIYEGRKYGKSCWNSDSGDAYYRTDMIFVEKSV